MELRGETAYRFTTHLPDRATHENLPPNGARERLGALLADYGQGLLQTPEADWQVLGETVLRRPPSGRHTACARPEEAIPARRGHTRAVPRRARRDDSGRKVRKSRYDKFRQVNRFLELVDDVVPSLRPEGALRVVDFGCGKSYLTFAIHHLLTELRGREVEIVGLDLKEDVIAACSSLAERSGRPAFASSAATSQASKPDGASTWWSACTPATRPPTRRSRRPVWQADAILAVPCCQKEAYGQLESSLLAPLLRHGLAKERFAALVTDTLRAQLLELAGYRAQLVEFVALEHTAKNVLIRAVKGAPAGADAHRAYEELRDSLGLDPALERLLRDPVRVRAWRQAPLRPNRAR